MFSIDLSFHLIYNNKGRGNGTREAEQFLSDSGALVSSLINSRRPATIKNYVTAIRSFRHFIDETNEKTVTAEALLQYEKWLQSSGIKRNTSSCYLRSLRAIYQQLYGNADTIFEKVFTHNDKTEKRAMQTSSVKQLASMRGQVPRHIPIRLDLFLRFGSAKAFFTSMQ